jgi:hypothetical protein
MRTPPRPQSLVQGLDPELFTEKSLQLNMNQTTLRLNQIRVPLLPLLRENPSEV